MHSSVNLHPLPINCITCDKELAIKCNQEGIDLFGKTQHCETYKKPIIRCYNCQKFNHIAKHCRGQQCAATTADNNIKKTKPAKNYHTVLTANNKDINHHHVLTTKHKLLKHIN